MSPLLLPRRTLACRFASFMLLIAMSTEAQDATPSLGKLVRNSPEFDQLIAPGTKIEVLASGFEWSEGPVWIKNGGYLLFSDIPRNSIMKWKSAATPAPQLSLFMKPSGYTGVEDYGREPGSNGLTTDKDGNLLLAEHGDRRISRLLWKNGGWSGGKSTIADKYQGKRLNSPNDVIVKSNGDIYFTDPPYGLPNRDTDPRRELDFCGVYRVKPNGEITLLTKELAKPNGLAFSPDEKFLYVAQSDPNHAIWMKYPVNADGTLGTGILFADVTDEVGKLPGLPDGLKVDQKGNIFATGPGGVYVFAPNGKLLGRIDTGQKTANCNWGDDGSTLYITADYYIVRVKTLTKGAGW